MIATDALPAITGGPSIAVDVANAGGLYADRPAMRDGPLITARKSDDLSAWLALFAQALSDRPANPDR
ncbi:MAG: hypothetical protein ABS36_01215 [Acidobacteria bacterium SCN 69-37]|nr:MAG: hypothetical protein ABS36_01215 [Acidobacteria bacterium SCN 69-37]